MSDERDNTLAEFFRSLGPDSMDCFRMFARGGANNAGCYVLGCWAPFVAKEYIKSAAVLRDWGTPEQPLDAVIVNDTLCREVIRDCLLRRGATVEFYDRAPGGGAYTCVQRGSPGNIADFEASLFAFEEAEIQLMSSGSLVFGPQTESTHIRVGFAALNTTLRQITFAEYDDTMQLVSLDALIAQSNLKELTLCAVKGSELEDTNERVRTVRRLCERNGVILQLNTLKELRQQTSSTLDSLQDLLRVPGERMTLNGNPWASHALENLLCKVDTLDPNNQSAFYLKHAVPSTYMKLDSAAIEALNLVSKKPEPRGSLPCSIFSWLNRCSTGMGSRMMRQWLLQPLRNVDDINQRLSMVELFVENPILRDMFISQVLKRCSDMDRLNRKLQRRTLALKDTQAFLNFVAIIPDALQVLKTAQGHYAKLLADECIAPLEDIHEHMGNLKTLIDATVDFSDKNMVRINPDFDDDLGELHVQITTIQRDIDKEYQRVLRAYDWNEKQLKYEYHATYGYVFRVSRKEDRQLRASKELITVSTAKDGVRFASEKLSALSDQYRRASECYGVRQQDLKQKLVDTIASYLPVLDDAKEMIAMLDVVIAWALVVKDSPRPMVRPRMHAVHVEAPAAADDDEEYVETPPPVVSLKNVRHPLVELRQPDYTANSTHLTGAMNGIIITGPNMGGKSTFMRSVGIAVVLAQAGCFVPADAADIQVRDSIMCRVGATDHLAQGVSTFMVEMIESAAILSSATSQTLAIVDELGRGTSTYDGFGLAWAIAEDIAVRLRATLLFSTHFHELTALPEQCQRLSNVHFGADVNEAEGTLKFSYRLDLGPCGRSYGLYVASLAHMPAEVVESAKAKAQELETFDEANSSSGSVSVSALVGSADEEAAKCLAVYAKRIREVESHRDAAARESARQRLKAEIQEDAIIRPLLSQYAAALAQPLAQ